MRAAVLWWFVISTQKCIAPNTRKLCVQFVHTYTVRTVCTVRVPEVCRQWQGTPFPRPQSAQGCPRGWRAATWLLCWDSQCWDTGRGTGTVGAVNLPASRVLVPEYCVFDGNVEIMLVMLVMLITFFSGTLMSVRMYLNRIQSHCNGIGDLIQWEYATNCQKRVRTNS